MPGSCENGPCSATPATLMRQTKPSARLPSAGSIATCRVLPPPFFHGTTRWPSRGSHCTFEDTFLMLSRRSHHCRAASPRLPLVAPCWRQHWRSALPDASPRSVRSRHYIGRSTVCRRAPRWRRGAASAVAVSGGRSKPSSTVDACCETLADRDSEHAAARLPQAQVLQTQAPGSRHANSWRWSVDLELADEVSQARYLRG